MSAILITVISIAIVSHYKPYLSHIDDFAHVVMQVRRPAPPLHPSAPALTTSHMPLTPYLCDMNHDEQYQVRLEAAAARGFLCDRPARCDSLIPSHLSHHQILLTLIGALALSTAIPEQSGYSNNVIGTLVVIVNIAAIGCLVLAVFGMKHHATPCCTRW